MNNLHHAPGEGSLLLQLPAELRNRIYTEVLTSSTPIRVTLRIDDVSDGTASALLRTCRRTRKEAGAVYYGTNTFSFRVRGPDYMLD